MPRSPLPQRHGLDAAWLRTPGDGTWSRLRDHLVERLIHVDPDRVDAMLAEGRFVDESGAVLGPDTPYRGDRIVWFHRDLPVEATVPEPITVLYADERIVVADKPHFLSTIPRGRHVMQSAVVVLRDRLGLPELGAAHRLDRLTAGVLLLTTQRRWRAAYQTVFERRGVTKSYEAIAHDSATGSPAPLAVGEERVVRSHLRKDRGVWQAYEVADAEPNAETAVRLLDRRAGRLRYDLRPHTGKTHQLRIHLLGLGTPIVDDPLYPEVRDVAVDDFSAPLQLLARTLSFTDPVDGTARHYTSERALAAWPEGGR